MFNVSVQDIQARWICSLPFPSNNIIETYIFDAETLILLHYPTIKDRLKVEKDLNRRLNLAVCQMVIRALQNPDKIRQQQETAGAFNTGVTYGAETLGGLEVTEAEKRLLAPIGSQKDKIFSITPKGFETI